MDVMLSNAKDKINEAKSIIEACMRCRGRNALSDIHSMLIDMDMKLSEARACIGAYDAMAYINNLN